MSAHTPGPWLCCDGPENYQHRIYVQESPVSGGTVCDVVLSVDAPLIAAAPDSHAANIAMLAALDEAFDIKAVHDDDRIYDELPSSGIARAYFMARDAIAKATQL